MHNAIKVCSVEMFFGSRNHEQNHYANLLPCENLSLFPKPPPYTQLSGEIAGIMEQLKALDDLKMAAAKDSMGEAAAGKTAFLHQWIWCRV